MFLQQLFKELNAGRHERLKEEMKVLRVLPFLRLNDCKRERIKVGPGSTIPIKHNVYSVPSRLIKEWVDVRIYAGHLEIWYAQKHIENIPRIKGEYKHFIQYRHIIDWLIRKPGAFENYRYRADLFPTSRFRMAYDYLKSHNPLYAIKEYLQILYLAARESEAGVDDALRYLFDREEKVTAQKVQTLIQSNRFIPSVTDIEIDKVNLASYDELLGVEVVYA